jgi:hypothetical protein
VADLLGLSWSPTVGLLSEADIVGTKIEVRSRWVPGTGADLGLFHHDKEKADRPFVLVHVMRPEASACFVKGWIFGREGLKRKYWRDLDRYKPHGACFIPPEELRDVTELIELRRKQ